MKKRMFNDTFRFTDMVLQGKKTMTSDILPELGAETELVGTNDKGEFEFRIGGNYETVAIKPKFKVGEVVAVAERYETLDDRDDWNYIDTPDLIDRWSNTPGWSNKMFVRGELMPHQIRIKNVKCERLQHISDEDCIKEGISRWSDFEDCPEAFAELINKTFGKDTWETNPYRIAYEFTLTQ